MLNASLLFMGSPIFFTILSYFSNISYKYPVVSATSFTQMSLWCLRSVTLLGVEYLISSSLQLVSPYWSSTFLFSSRTRLYTAIFCSICSGPS